MSATTAETKTTDTLTASLVHAIGLPLGLFGIAFVYFMSDDRFVKRNARNALNWHIPVSVFAVGIALIGVIVSELVGVVMAVSVALTTVCFALFATAKAYRGEAWPYPLVPKLL